MAATDRIDQVFCLPYAGGTSMIFTKWPRPVGGPSWRGLDYPGHLLTMRQPPATSIPQLAAGLLPRLLDQADGPYALFGVSLGALVGYELARAAEAAGRPPALLVLAACPAPCQLPWGPEYFSSQDDGAFLAAFAERYRGMDVELLADPAIRGLVTPVLRKDVALYGDYAEAHHSRPPVPVAADLLVINGTEDITATAARAERWRDYSTGAVECLEVPGDHFFVDKRSAELTALLAERLGRIPAR
ncbi:medium-chain acyl-[acyl-carrier-protein] hydrolase [Kitasatospora sp. GP30]|uniref:thioesterase II family protein n=1 Tax=Kitasatospora sp. GP30 TaxID=3035084 RepID=UPI000CC7F8AB|nr:thioesterase domain-containing protein [Kitasatospora sp. GP30]MDH6144077.1 medium-chain acyl-[acyl-carrier-protein] hydrolase [Kitasatospora sp. GP30]